MCACEEVDLQSPERWTLQDPHWKPEGRLLATGRSFDLRWDAEGPEISKVGARDPSLRRLASSVVSTGPADHGVRTVTTAAESALHAGHSVACV